MFKIFDEETKKNRPHFCIREYKRMLADTDYLAIKYAEGLLTPEEYEAIKSQRQVWRAEINELEERIGGQNG